MTAPLSPNVIDLLKLNLVPGLGPRLTASLLEQFGSPQAILQAEPDELSQVPHIGAKLARDFHQAIRKIEIDQELERISRHQVHLLALGSPEYPATLATISGPPHLLFIQGSIQPADAKAVALVGSRHCTAYGKRVAERLAKGLVKSGYTVVSGLARGIDGAAHRAALQAGGRTLAVLAGGLSKIYPPEHAELARDVQASGALITESSMSMEPMAAMFPARNRLISGLSQASVIIEAAERSGALITARHAAEQGRSVLAVPGLIESAASGGTHKLIREGAILVRGVEDILEELEGTAPIVAPPPKATPPLLSESDRRLWDFLGDQPRHVDEIARQLQIPVQQLTGALMLLEMKKVVRRLPGNYYERA